MEAENNSSYYTQEEEDEISHLALRIQLSATAVATSFLLIFVPNVETLTLTAFILGYLFSYRFAMTTILTMGLTWEILASMVFAFSGITFPFKIIAWLLVGSIGHFARSVRAKYFYEFLIYGAISAVLFDFLVTIPSAFLFVQESTAFLTVLLSNLILGALFTVSHTVSSAIFFAFIPAMMKVILPLLHDNYPELIKVPIDRFDYLKDIKGEQPTIGIIKTDKKRLAIYFLTGLLISMLLVAGTVQFLQPEDVTSDPIEITLTIDYDGVLPNETYLLDVVANNTIFQLLSEIAIINYTMQFGNEVYVEAINGVWENQNLSQHYWLYYINDVWSNQGANSKYPQDGDIISWRYM